MNFILLVRLIVGRAKLNARNYRRAIIPASVLLVAFVFEVVPAIKIEEKEVKIKKLIILLPFFQIQQSMIYK